MDVMMQESISRIPLQVIYSKRKSIGMEIHTDGSVIVRAPERMTKKELNSFLERHWKWILEKRAVMQQRERNRQEASDQGKERFPVYETLSAAQKRQIKEKIAQRVEKYSAVMHVQVNRITVRNQKTRWGSCSSKGNVNFNYRLAYLPQELLDYVVIHELAHRKYMNHSKEFWFEVEKFCPDYRSCKKSLRELYS